MAEVRDDFKSFTISVIAPEPGRFQIINYSFPASAKAGAEVDGTVTVKNIGGAMAELRVKLIEADTGKLIDKEPDTYYKNVNAGETVSISVGTSWNPLWAMPNKNWSLRVEAWRQT